ncbi:MULTISPECIES: DeoR/GlpR family DNA-binding transcription regulator [Delftia]|uniref:DeoR/GlpR transcriptional regulator n=2 Tax=Pseudomonadati TaxID=3379134 RepID=A0A2G7T2S0_9FLAO|nr:MULTISPECIES: DeoR family transcriptional regulator [Delftia]KZK28031.1 DeoR family transcriptional regulator [Delftia sp. GW456-R20]MBO0990566.1 DeoR/GlpR transcriptional regulator [Delftia sp. SD083]MBO1037445.1 DeoR/GlpR transcriptional regulator [Delftia sp. SD018]MCA1067131.1 Glycerol-3-phosphate regulon repressor [Delftia acidovorans]PJO39908.1 DeoR/GlpR transcriptional regulator [Delftia acidovorans]
MQDQGNSSLKRRLQIVELARKTDEVRVEALSVLFGVSTVTIRNDLHYLEQQGYVVRAFGKARYNPALLKTAAELPGAPAAAQGPAQAQVAQGALGWIEDDASVFLGSGRITHRVLPLLASRQGIALTLHDLAMVATARQFLDCAIHVTGGTLAGDEPGLIGPGAEAGLRARPLDICLFEICGIDDRNRLLCRDPGAARLYSAAVEHSTKAVALALDLDSTTGGHPVCDIAQIDGLCAHQDMEPGAFDLLAHHRLQATRKAEGRIEFART